MLTTYGVIVLVSEAIITLAIFLCVSSYFWQGFCYQRATRDLASTLKVVSDAETRHASFLNVKEMERWLLSTPREAGSEAGIASDKVMIAIRKMEFYLEASILGGWFVFAVGIIFMLLSVIADIEMVR